MNFLKQLKAYLNNKEIVKRLVFTLILLFIFRLLAKVPAPGIDADALQELFGGEQSGFFNIANVLAGGTLSQFSIISVGLFAFINASVIFQLLGSIVPKIEQLQKMGEVGRKIINQWTRLLTVPLAALQSFGIYLLLRSQELIEPISTFRIASLIIVLTGGTMLLVWLAELISEKGLGGRQGGGISVIITAGILASLPTSITQVFAGITTSNFLQKVWIALGIEMLLFIVIIALLIALYKAGFFIFRHTSKLIKYPLAFLYTALIIAIPGFVVFVLKVDTEFTRDTISLWETYTSRLNDIEYRFGFYLGLSLQLVAIITFFNESFRKIPIKFVSRIRSMQKATEESSYLPVKILAPGVMPIIFSSSLLLLPQVIYRFFGTQIQDRFPTFGNALRFASEGWLNQQFSLYYYALNFILVVLFSLFFITVIMKPEDIANDLKSRKTFIPGVRPGKETIEYLSKTILRVTFWGGLVIALVSSLPFIFGIYNSDVSSGIENFIAGGTSILIVVPTVLAIKMQLDALVLTKNYEKFEEL